ncbi:hypothetical protein J6590_105472, partial [Homalodisca vitripennis]
GIWELAMVRKNRPQTLPCGRSQSEENRGGSLRGEKAALAGISSAQPWLQPSVGSR